MGICHMEGRKFDAARKCFFDIVDSESDSVEVAKALLFIGESYYRQGIPAEADHYFGQVIDRYPHADLKNGALYRLGWSRIHSGEWTSAAEAFERGPLNGKCRTEHRRKPVLHSDEGGWHSLAG